MTYLETYNDARNQRFEVYDKAIKDRFHNKYTGEAFTDPNSTNPNMGMWYKLVDDDKDFQSKFNKVFDNPDVKDADEEFTTGSYNNYVSMELTLD